MTLHHEVAPPADGRGGGPLVVLLHGRGSHERDLLGLQPYLPESASVVCPRALHPGGPWGYGPGWAWYRFLGTRSPDLESFEASQAALEELLTRLPDIAPAPYGSVVLGGFSQGGVMSMAYALRAIPPASGIAEADRPRVRHIMNLSGFLPELGTVAVTPETVRGTRFFWGHGTEDRQISLEWAEVGRGALRAANADLDAFDYPAGHTITRDELGDLRRWIESIDAGSGATDGSER